MQEAKLGEATQFGRYQLIASLGHGGMADVYLAVAHGPGDFNKLLVIKHLRPHLAEEPEFLTMFLDEARLAARLHHPNVVQTNEVGEVDGQFFIAMEYLEGQPLNRILHRQRAKSTLPLEMGLAMISDVLAGLEYAHTLSDYDGLPLDIVHRDVSPHNIFVTYDGQTKLVDFGIAKAATRSAETRTGVMKGKVVYMSPEQSRCDTVDRRADLFAVGVVLWEMVARRRMWIDLSEYEVLAKLANGETPRLDEVRPGLAPELYAICSRALARDASARYQTAAELRADIEQLFQTNLKRPTHEAIGSAVAEMFADRREALQQVVDTQLRNLSHARKRGVSVNLVDLRALTATGTLAQASSKEETAAETTPSQGTLGHIAISPSPSAMPASPVARSLPVTSVLAVLCTVLLMVGAFALFREEPAATTPPPPIAAPTVETTASSPPAHVTAVRVRIDVSPPNATIRLDGRKVANPYDEQHMPDGAAHILRFEAPGHIPDEREIPFDRDRALTVALAKTDASRQPPRTAIRPPPAPQPAPAAAPKRGALGEGPGTPDKRPLDSTDPWAQ